MEDGGCGRDPERAIIYAAAAMAAVSIMTVRAQEQGTELQEEGGSQVWVKTPGCGTAAIRVGGEDTTESLWQTGARRLNIPPKLPRLMYGGWQLRKQGPLRQQGVCRGATVHVVFRLRGGSMDRRAMTERLIEFFKCSFNYLTIS